ncbi:hypothetical protein Scep_028150 [Stephania cephalantha]|uniref:Transmembrane protein n=1 Tax=Stephania cephalantha TaxID=152367 RepID=A0AAP0HHV8_9MAGN
MTDPLSSHPLPPCLRLHRRPLPHSSGHQRAPHRRRLRVPLPVYWRKEECKGGGFGCIECNEVEFGGARSPPSPAQALLGGLAAGVIAIILYKFTTTIEAALNRQTISDNFSVRQITITVRTIVNGLCYLATFVFGINSIGLILYSGQLVINSFMGESTDKQTSNKDDGQLSTTSSSDNFSDNESSDSGRDKSNPS